jgi:transposase/DNA-binding XRE family transcriptional regulator
MLTTGIFPADATGYDDIARAIGSPDDCIVVGMEGTGSYGAGAKRRLEELGYEIVEVVRPKRDKRRIGDDKNDLADAERAARDALAGKASGKPKAGNGWVESVRFRMVAREAAVRASTSAANSVHALMITAPSSIRERFTGMETGKMMESLSRRRRAIDEFEAAIWDSLRSLALSWKDAKIRASEQEESMRTLLQANAPALLDMYGCGTISAAQLAIAAGDNPERMENEAAFASLCGASPIEASSGKVKRHRLNRGGNRQANRALHTIARQRMRCDRKTRSYVEKRQQEGKTKREVERCLVRYIAREAYRALIHPLDTNWFGYRDFADSLKKKRAQLGATQKEAADSLGVASARISELERGILLDESLLLLYRDWIENIAAKKRWLLEE